MKAAWYEKQGAARNVLVVGEMDDPQPREGEVRIRLVASGINPGDVKKRQDAFLYGMPYPRVIPNSDGAGTIDQVGHGVPKDWIGKRVWCYGAQTYRPFGTAAEYTVVPVHQAVPLAPTVSMEQGACLGIPGITAHRSVHVGGPVHGQVVLVQGGAGAVGACAVRLARQAGANDVLLVDETLSQRIRALIPGGVDHIVEVAFSENIQCDIDVLAQGGSIAAYATADPNAEIPFWPLVFGNASIHFIGSDDVPAKAKIQATHDLNRALDEGWLGLPIAARFSLDDIASAHEFAEHPTQAGRVILTL